MLTTLLARTAHLTAAIVSATLVVVYVTIVPVPARVSNPVVTITAQR